MVGMPRETSPYDQSHRSDAVRDQTAVRRERGLSETRLCLATNQCCCVERWEFCNGAVRHARTTMPSHMQITSRRHLNDMITCPSRPLRKLSPDAHSTATLAYGSDQSQ
eukprot:scaffold678276_cov45-Prasinocladus_malaysianus.AAC.1